MKKFIILLLIFMNMTSIQAITTPPRYQIYAHSNHQDDLNELYEIKNEILMLYRKRAKGVTNYHKVIEMLAREYNGVYKDKVLVIKLKDGKGEMLEGYLKSNYCVESKDIKKKSLIQELLNHEFIK